MTINGSHFDMKKIYIYLPTKPAWLTTLVIPKVLHFIREVSTYHMEGVYKASSTNDMNSCHRLEFMRPDDWNEDDTKKFLAFVSHFAWQEAKKHSEK